MSGEQWAGESLRRVDAEDGVVRGDGAEFGERGVGGDGEVSPPACGDLAVRLQDRTSLPRGRSAPSPTVLRALTVPSSKLVRWRLRNWFSWSLLICMGQVLCREVSRDCAMNTFFTTGEDHRLS
jgi:hypothetical protein